MRAIHDLLALQTGMLPKAKIMFPKSQSTTVNFVIHFTTDVSIVSNSSLCCRAQPLRHCSADVGHIWSDNFDLEPAERFTSNFLDRGLILICLIDFL